MPRILHSNVELRQVSKETQLLIVKHNNHEYKFAVKTIIAMWARDPYCKLCGLYIPYVLYNVEKQLVKFPPHLKMSKDHIVPKSLGGSDELSNLQLACSRCNRKRGNFLIEWFQ